jgi:hypothetical protein
MASKLTIIPGALGFTHDTISTNSTVVVTKTYSNPYLYVVSDDGRQLTVMGQPEQYNQHTFQIAYDPLKDHMAWYGISKFHDRQISIQIEEIEQQRFWRRSEFDDWFETECTHTVFAQAIYADMWTLTFVDLADLEAFKKWWFEPRGVTLQVIYPFDYRNNQKECHDIVGEIKIWCHSLVTSLFDVHSYSDYVRVEFEDENEALMFKLAWSNRATITTVIQ